MASDSDVVALLDEVKLLGISYFELSASRSEGAPESDGERPGDGEELDIEPQFTLGFAKANTAERFQIRVKTEIQMPIGAIVVDIASEYELQDSQVADVTDDLLVAFVNKVAMMTLIPYIRQSVSDLTARVFEVPLVMPMYRQGELTFPPPDAEANT
ncbi:hypothetical protein AL755_08425 [Arthrobacter sp. ERGS1:01]|uniref:hypothetical protein n=1 Tax=Arthrobacter sp. ERGS1:01 TaxID=1704044 RepID=UPI0006B4D9A9|nr:hypothetical protein [Arthrobacter sp. ERGS1:01]ALE05497.1 hypothetical protein AL755_08425 [Arthrobacter sp. ERGS1:01]